MAAPLRADLGKSGERWRPRRKLQPLCRWEMLVAGQVVAVEVGRRKGRSWKYFESQASGISERTTRTARLW